MSTVKPQYLFPEVTEIDAVVYAWEQGRMVLNLLTHIAFIALIPYIVFIFITPYPHVHR